MATKSTKIHEKVCYEDFTFCDFLCFLWLPTSSKISDLPFATVFIPVVYGLLHYARRT